MADDLLAAMDLRMPSGLADGYTSATQKARVVTESWGSTNLYCPACASPRLGASPANTQAIDYVCPGCGLPFQLNGLLPFRQLAKRAA